MIRNTINNEYCSRVKRVVYFYDLSDRVTATDSEAATPVSISDPPIFLTERDKGLQPVGTGDKRKCDKSKAVISSNNEITNICITKRLQAGTKKLKRGRLVNIIGEVILRNNLTEYIVINKALIRQRIK